MDEYWEVDTPDQVWIIKAQFVWQDQKVLYLEDVDRKEVAIFHVWNYARRCYLDDEQGVVYDPEDVVDEDLAE